MRDDDLRPYLKAGTLYWCINDRQEYFFWFVRDDDEDGHEMAKSGRGRMDRSAPGIIRLLARPLCGV
jgi:hypothetical protein